MGRPSGRWWWSAALLAVMAGAAAQMQREQVLPPTAAATFFVTGGLALVALAWLARIRGSEPPAGARSWTSLASIGLIALAVFALTEWRAGLRLQERLSPSLEGADLVLTGTVAELPRLAPDGLRLVLEVEAVEPASAAIGVPPRVSLGWYAAGSGAEAGGALPLVQAGDRWRLPVRLRQPHGARNPHGFDLELWLFERDIGASGGVRPGAQRLGAGAAHPVERWRQHVRDAILLRVPDPVAAGVVAALAVGDQAAIDSEGWELFRTTGVAHLMSISGLHVTLFAWLAAGVVGWAWRRSERLMLWVPAVTAARLGGLGLAAAYALLAGWGVPAQRTVGMLAVVTVLRLSAARWPPTTVLLAAAAAVTLLDPWALLQPGFWLSFAAVGLLMLSDAGRDGEATVEPALDESTLVLRARGMGQRLRAALRTQAVATVGLAPLTLLFFQQLSLAGFVANLLAIPLVTLVVTPLALAGMVLPPLWTAAAAVVQALMQGLQGLAAWTHAVWNTAAVSPWVAALGLLGGALMVLPLPLRLRLAGAALLLPLLWPVVPRPQEGRFEVVLADVGQGTAVLVRTHAHLLVYDAGPQYAAESDAGQRVLLPLLRARGERAVDLLVLSHRDADHVGGAASLMRGLPVHAVSSSLEPWHPLRAALPTHRRCEAGQRWAWDGVSFDILHPLPLAETPLAASNAAATARPNALSCVLRVTAADGTRLLLTGDIEAPQEAELLAREGASLRSDMLLVPHHGSRTSSTAAFIDAVRPGAALVQAGYRSRFGHPAPDVVDRYLDAGATVIRTDRCGAWTWPPGRCEREHRRRYWHHRAGVGQALASEPR